MSGASGEDRFIARFLRPIAGSPGALGLLDDAALLTPPEGMDLVLTKDALVAGVHFFPDDPPEAIARKALRVNLSDLAAKGALPLGILLALALPKALAAGWMEAFAAGLGTDCADFACPLLGGDTVATPGPVVLSVTAFGAVPKGGFVPRTGARPGQAIVVSGTIGDAALGLALRTTPDAPGFRHLDAAARAHLLDRYLHPRPRVALAPVLRAHAAAAMDISDGLAGDLAKMLDASGCGGRIAAERVPLSAAVRAAIAADPALLRTALTGGDDYEILACVSQERAEAFIADAAAAGVPAAVLGATCAKKGLVVEGADGAPLDLGRGAFSHF